MWVSHTDVVSLGLKKTWVCYVAKVDCYGLSTYPYPFAIPLCSGTAILFGLLTFKLKVPQSFETSADIYQMTHR